VIVIVLTVLPADALASVVLTVALVAILGDALTAELSLGAVAIAGKLALAFTAGPAAVLAPVLNPGTSATRSPLVADRAKLAMFVVVVPIRAAALTMLVVVMCHFGETPFLVCEGGASHAGRLSRPMPFGSQGVCHGDVLVSAFE
jgi:hypothetical protein